MNSLFLVTVRKLDLEVQEDKGGCNPIRVPFASGQLCNCPSWCRKKRRDITYIFVKSIYLPRYFNCSFSLFSDMTRHLSTDSTPSDSGSSPSDSGSSPSDSGSSPSPSTPQKLLPACTSPFGPRLFHASTSSSGTTRPQPEGSDHRNTSTPRLSGKLGGHGPCGRHVPVKMERIKVCVLSIWTYLQFFRRSAGIF